MLDVLESVRRIVYRWVNTQSPLLSNANPGDDILTVESTKRLQVGDQIALVQYDNALHQPRLYVEEILDNNRIRLTDSVRGSKVWRVSDNTVIRKTFDSGFFEGVYIGDPDVIAKFPAVTIMGESRSSEWLTIGSTKEDYRLQITVFVKQDSNERSYRSLLKITEAIERGLKNNIFPLIGPFNLSNLTADYIQGDTFIKVEDTSKYKVNQSVVIENLHRSEESAIKCIVDDTTLQLHMPFSNSYSKDDQTKVIGLTRFIYNSWPANINYGHIHKGSLMHAATIEWFAWEQEIQETGGWKDPQLT
jgi:hypothetical protein